MKVAYDVKESARHQPVEYAVQYKYGLCDKPFWERVENGELDTHKLQGKITRVFEDDIGHWPYIEVTDSNGEKTEWARHSNRNTEDCWYQIGKQVEITYCIEERIDEYTKRPWQQKCVLLVAVHE